MKSLLLLPSGKIICWWYLWGANYYLSLVFMRFQLLQYLGARYNIEISMNVIERGLCSSHPSAWPPSLEYFSLSSASHSFSYLWGIRGKVNFALCCENNHSLCCHPEGPWYPQLWASGPEKLHPSQKIRAGFFFFFFLISSYDRFWSHFVWEVQQWCWREDHGVGISLGTTLEGRQEGSTAEDTLPLVGTDAMHTRAETSASSSVAWVCFSCRLCRANTHAWDDFWNPASCSKWDSWNQTRCCFQAFAVSQKVSQNNESFELLGPEAA